MLDFRRVNKPDFRYSLLYRYVQFVHNHIYYRRYHVSRQCKKTTQQTICYLKTEKEKRNEKPTHKTAHLQATTHKPMLQLAKELFSCRHTSGY